MNDHRTEIRLPTELASAMIENARLSGRSLNAQINFVLRWWLTSDEAEHTRLEQELGWGLGDDKSTHAL